MLGGGIKFLSQLLAIVGASSCPILYYGSKSFISEEEREVNWTIELTNSEGSKELSGRKWKYQDAEIKKWCWPDNFGDDESNDIYKLQLKKELTKKHKGLPKGLSFRNPFELIKVGFGVTKKGDESVGGGNGKKMLQLEKRESWKTPLKDKLHLLVLKTENSINFVSALRKTDDDFGNFKGINNVEAGERSNNAQWKDAENSQLLKKGNDAEVSLEKKKKKVLLEEVNGKKTCEKTKNWGKIVWEHWALIELGGNKWVVLDWFGLGTKFEDYKNVEEVAKHASSSGTTHKKWDFFQSKLKEKVTEAISIKFEEVVISDEGIGDGKDIQIKWSGDNRPKFISQLNR
ncbi:hypothetical protein WEN_01910 [Mycoplasma wenyonii str. Massachusetts]|uniref:Lipoprotein n=1 Tax=Mycoplasma wenyonii (strain Massachusetts) TaxID=1197325 RepID=I6ZIZ3_MYCWM|nr:hypothetical protein [Mycoplasma wenyonii]AFN65175.1 hypothetical protein WEN_01910 [Mycoplasma wenyonii str. Massachusetts]